MLQLTIWKPAIQEVNHVEVAGVKGIGVIGRPGARIAEVHDPQTRAGHLQIILPVLSAPKLSPSRSVHFE